MKTYKKISSGILMGSIIVILIVMSFTTVVMIFADMVVYDSELPLYRKMPDADTKESIKQIEE